MLRKKKVMGEGEVEDPVEMKENQKTCQVLPEAPSNSMSSMKQTEFQDADRGELSN